MAEQQQANFEGWAKVEVMGHQSHIGYVRTEAYGAAVMFRIDAPALPEREYVLEHPEYVNGSWTPAGAVVRREAVPGHSVLVGAGSIYRMTPCDEAAAMRAIERTRPELKLVSLPEAKALPAGESPEDSDDPTDDDSDDDHGWD
jgi:hypothetical protein